MPRLEKGRWPYFRIRESAFTNLVISSSFMLPMTFSKNADNTPMGNGRSSLPILEHWPFFKLLDPSSYGGNDAHVLTIVFFLIQAFAMWTCQILSLHSQCSLLLVFCDLNTPIVLKISLILQFNKCLPASFLRDRLCATVGSSLGTRCKCVDIFVLNFLQNIQQCCFDFPHIIPSFATRHSLLQWVTFCHMFLSKSWKWL